MENTNTAQENVSLETKKETSNSTPKTEFVSKELFDRKVSELNSARKKAEEALKARMSEEEQAKAAQEEKDKEFSIMQKELVKLRNERVFLSNGFDDNTAQELSEAFSSGDLNSFLKTHKKWLDGKLSDLEAENKKLKMEKIPPVNSGAQRENYNSSVDYARNLAKKAMEGQGNQAEILKKYM